jgi:peptide chain release factor 3
MGRDFLGIYDLFADALLLFERGVHDRVTEPVRCSGLDDPQLLRLLPKEALAKLREEIEMAKGLCPPFDPQAYRESQLTPVYFGSALNNFGVRELLRVVCLPLYPQFSTTRGQGPGPGFHAGASRYRASRPISPPHASSYCLNLPLEPCGRQVLVINWHSGQHTAIDYSR